MSHEKSCNPNVSQESQAEALAPKWTPVEFECTHLTVLQREDTNSPMKVVGTIRLEGKQEALPAVVASIPTASIPDEPGIPTAFLQEAQRLAALVRYPDNDEAVLNYFADRRKFEVSHPF